MESKWFLISCLILVVVLMSFVESSNGYKFFVGGKDGWVLNPSEKYNHWAERMRFQVNDTLYFKYKKESDSVLVVKGDDYNLCNKNSPIKTLTGGDSIFKFDRSGSYFFISGESDNCQKGQKLIVVVMAVRHNTTHQAPPSPPTPVPSPPPPSPGVPKSSPPAEPPKSTPPPAATDSSTSANDDVPAPSPSDNSASMGLGCSVGSILGYSIGVSVVLGSFVGMF